MTRIILSGCGGKMGAAVAQVVAGRSDCEIVAGFDINTELMTGFPVFASPADCTVEADVIIDFSLPAALYPLLDYAKAKHLPLVECTTGFSQQQIADIKSAAAEIPVFFSGNMSLGINLLISLSKTAASILGDTFDIEIIEKHHNQKIDAPSGTALMIANGISDVLAAPPRYEYDRHSKRAKREKNEIGIHAVRGGTIVGEHEVIFAGHNEVITLSHSAQSKGVFAAGAVNAAVFIAGGRAAGLYDMSQLISENAN